MICSPSQQHPRGTHGPGSGRKEQAGQTRYCSLAFWVTSASKQVTVKVIKVVSRFSEGPAKHIL